MKREAKNVSISALMLIRPRPSVTGTISLNVCLTTGSRQSSTIRSRSSPRSMPRSHGSGRKTWMNVAIRIENA